MQISQAERTYLLQKYEPYIRSRTALFFKKAANLNRNRFEDLLQESRFAFFRLMDKAEDEIDLVKRAPMCMFSAMWEFCRNMAPVYLPRDQYQRLIFTYTCVSLEANGLDFSLAEDLTEKMCFGLAFEAALQKMPKQEQIALEMCSAGYSNREIMKQLHLQSDVATTRLLKRARKHLVELLELPQELLRGKS